MSSHKWVVARAPNCGFGDQLLTLLGAFVYAKKTERNLLIDWRGNNYCSERDTNWFNNIFTIESSKENRIFFSHPGIEHSLLGPPYFPNKWTQEKISSSDLPPGSAAENAALSALVESGHDRPEPTVVFDARIPMRTLDKQLLRPFLENLHFNTSISEQARTFIRSDVGEERFIAIHLRHGNGENIGARCIYWLDPLDTFRQLIRNETYGSFHDQRLVAKSRFQDGMPDSLTSLRSDTRSEHVLYKKIKLIVEKIRSQNEERVPVVLFTDSDQIHERLRNYVPDTVRYRKTGFSSGQGPLHNKNLESDQRESLASDMIVEAAALKKCSYLIYFPSNFSILPRLTLPSSNQFLLRPTPVNRLVHRSFNAIASRIKRHK